MLDSRTGVCLAALVVGSFGAGVARAQLSPQLRITVDAGGSFDQDTFEVAESTGGAPLSLSTSFLDSDGPNTWSADSFALGAGGPGGNYFRLRGSSRAGGVFDEGFRGEETSRSEVLLRDTMRFRGAGGAPLDHSINVSLRTSMITNLNFSSTLGINVEPDTEATASVSFLVYDEAGQLKSGTNSGIMGRSHRQNVNDSTGEVNIFGMSGIQEFNDTYDIELDPGDSIGVQLTMSAKAQPAEFGIGGSTDSDVEIDGYSVDAFADNIFKLWVDEIQPLSGPSPLSAVEGYEVLSDYGIDYTVADPVPAPSGLALGVAGLVLGSRRRRVCVSGRGCGGGAAGHGRDERGDRADDLAA